MQRLMNGIMILGIVSARFCLNSNAETQIKYVNMMDYGAHADGKTDDSNVYISVFLFSHSLYINVLYKEWEKWIIFTIIIWL